MNNKYLLSVFLCLLSATAAKASPKNYQSNTSNKRTKLESNQTNKNLIKSKIDFTRQTWLGSLVEPQQPNLLLTKWLPSVRTTKHSTNVNTLNQSLQISSPPVTGNNEANYHTTAVPLTDEVNASPVFLRRGTVDQPIKVSSNLIAQDPLGQVNRVSELKSQLNDVTPNDWAFEALRSLADRYNCISGFEDGTFRGQETLTRYEFAAGLDSCLQKIESLIAEQETVAPEDLETIGRLSQEFETELASLSGRVDSLEAQIESIEDNQFSTTTVLNGEVIFAFADVWGGNPPGGCEELNLNLQNGISSNVVNCGLRNGEDSVSTAGEPDAEGVLAYLARLGFQASFSGQDRLRMYLTTGNFDNGGFTSPEAFNTYSPRFSYQAGLENQVVLNTLEYRFPAFNDRVAFYASGYGFALSNVLTANSPYFDIGRGSVSRFGQLNPIFRIGGAMDAGVGFDWLIADPVRLQAAYGTRDSGSVNGGFFGSDFSTFGAQLLLQPTDDIVTGITYVNAYSSDGSLGTYTGSVNAETAGLWSGGRLPNEVGAFPGLGTEIGDFPAKINAVGGTFQWNLSSQFNLGASAAYTFTDYLDGIPEFDLDGQIPGVEQVAGEKPFANTLNYQISLGLSDPLGREGDLLGFIFGMPPKLVDAGPTTPGQTVPFSEQVINNEDPVTITDNDPRQFLTRSEEVGDPNNDFLVQEGTVDQFGRKDEATSLHFEVFYRYKFDDNVWITPGFFAVTNPGHIADNDNIYVGTLRTTFRF